MRNPPPRFQDGGFLLFLFFLFIHEPDSAEGGGMENSQFESQVQCLLLDSFQGGQAEAFKCLPCFRGQADFNGAHGLADG